MPPRGRLGAGEAPELPTAVPTPTPPIVSGDSIASAWSYEAEGGPPLPVTEDPTIPKHESLPPSQPPPAWFTQRGWRFGRFELLGELATGGMAEIYLARERGAAQSSRLVVVKVVKPVTAEDVDFLTMFRDEGHLVMRLAHPNIAHVYEYGEAESRHYLSMEWVRGHPLGKIRKHLDERGDTLPIPLAVHVVAQVADALDHAHRARDDHGRLLGIVHRDVSPQNIMVSYDGVVKLLDFGVAKARSRLTTTQAGVVRGKFAYMSPQQCLGLPLDARSDIFSLGVVLHELLTGKPLYEGAVEFEIMRDIIEGNVRSPRDRNPAVPVALESIVMKALAKEPGERFETAAAFLEALEQFLLDRRELVQKRHVGAMLDQEFPRELGPHLNRDTELLLRLPRWGNNDDDDGRAPALDSATTSTLPPGPAAGADHPPASAAGSLVAPGAPASSEALGGATAPRYVWLWLSLAAAAGLLIITLSLALLAGGSDGESPSPSALAKNTTEPGAGARSEDPRSGIAGSPAPGASGEPSGAEPSGAEPSLGEEPATGATLVVRSTPPGARIRIDGEERGLTPLTVEDLEPTTIEIRARLAGHVGATREVTLEAGQTAELELELRRQEASTSGTLAINTRPWSRVFAGGRSLGTTPIARARVPAGAVRLRLVDGSGQTHVRVVRVPANGHQSAFFDLD